MAGYFKKAPITYSPAISHRASSPWPLPTWPFLPMAPPHLAVNSHAPCLDLFFTYNFFAVTSHHFVEPLVLSVLDFGWFCLWVSKPGGSIITHTLLSLACNDLTQSQLWFSRPRPVPILHLGMVRLPLEWPPNVTFGITGRGKIRTQDLATQSLTLYRLSYPGRFLVWILLILQQYKKNIRNVPSSIAVLPHFSNLLIV